jgi:hypothetical protein
VIVVDVGKAEGLGVVDKQCIAGQNSQEAPPQLKYFTFNKFL